ncbi:hypothetical protein D3C72_2484640 [compost metagenome]
MQWGAGCLQVASLTHPLPQLLPLAGSSMALQVATKLKQLRCRYLAGVQRVKGKRGQNEGRE